MCCVVAKRMELRYYSGSRLFSMEDQCTSEGSSDIKFLTERVGKVPIVICNVESGFLRRIILPERIVSAISAYSLL